MDEQNDPMTSALDQAAEQLRAALHAVRGAPVEPNYLYARAAELVVIMSRAKDLAVALSDQVDKAATDHVLGSDDESAAQRHVENAAGSLLLSATEADDARRLADVAFTALSHLRLDRS